MVVCNCHGFRPAQVLRAIREEGACSPGDIFRAEGRQACCGGCIPELERILRAEGVGPECHSCAHPCHLALHAS